VLTRLKVSGFKSLVDVDVRFGPFTCIAGANGAGKSNLFDAILFLSALADDTLVKAAETVRGSTALWVPFGGLFQQTSNDEARIAERILLEAEMVLPKSGHDDQGQELQASATMVRYKVEIGWRSDDSDHWRAGSLRLMSESLDSVPSEQHREFLAFPHAAEWRESLGGIGQKRTFISTRGEEWHEEVVLHPERPGEGVDFATQADSRPRTVVSSVADSRYPTVALARLEMRSWRRFQLEGAAMRKADPLGELREIGSDGAHLPSNLYAIAHAWKGRVPPSEAAAYEVAVYARAANRLAELIGGVRSIHVDRDEARELFTLSVVTPDGVSHPAAALSDGTLRFLALTILQLDPRGTGLFCIEEPENGIHPRRIASLLRLLQEIATDTSMAVDEDNPLRQVIINTHSPTVVLQVPEDSLLVAESVAGVRDVDTCEQRSVDSADWNEMTAPVGSSELHDAVVNPHCNTIRVRFWQSRFSCLAGTWREKGHPDQPVVSLGLLLDLLNPSVAEKDAASAGTRVMDRADVREQLPGLGTGT
jgi:predicted ATPase